MSDSKNQIVPRLKQKKSVSSSVFTVGHFFDLVLLLQTIAVTFREILHGGEEGVTVAMTERIFDWSRATSRRDSRVRKMRTVGRDGV